MLFIFIILNAYMPIFTLELQRITKISCGHIVNHHFNLLTKKCKNV